MIIVHRKAQLISEGLVEYQGQEKYSRSCRISFCNYYVVVYKMLSLVKPQQEVFYKIIQLSDL